MKAELPSRDPSALFSALRSARDEAFQEIQAWQSERVLKQQELNSLTELIRQEKLRAESNKLEACGTKEILGHHRINSDVSNLKNCFIQFVKQAQAKLVPHRAEEEKSISDVSSKKTKRQPADSLKSFKNLSPTQNQGFSFDPATPSKISLHNLRNEGEHVLCKISASPSRFLDNIESFSKLLKKARSSEHLKATRETNPHEDDNKVGPSLGDIIQNSISMDLLRNTLSFKHRKTFEAHLDSVRIAKVTEEGTLLTAGDDAIVKTWDVSCEKEKLRVWNNGSARGHSSPIFSASLFKNSLVTGSSKGEIIVWRVDSSVPQKQFQINSGHEPIWSLLLFSPSLLLSSSPNTLKLWDSSFSLKKPLAKLPRPNNFFGLLTPLSQSSFAAHVFSPATLKSTVECFDLNKSLFLSKQKFFSKEPITSLKFVQNLNCFLVGLEGGGIGLWDQRRGSPEGGSFVSSLLHGGKAHSGAVTGLAYGGEGLVASVGEGEVRLWDLRKGGERCVGSWEGMNKKFDESIFDVEFLGVQRVLVTAGADSCVNLFEY